MIAIAGGAERLRPHVKTHKIAEVIERFPKSRLAVTVDSETALSQLGSHADNTGKLIDLFVDLDNGMHRTGIDPDGARGLIASIVNNRNLRFRGLHIYDGHIHEVDPAQRKAHCDSDFEAVTRLIGQLETDGVLSHSEEHLVVSLNESLALWENPNEHTPVCYLLSLEGADSIISMRHLEMAYEDGLRAIGPAHYGPGIYANGTDSSGRLNTRGTELLKTMDQLNMILDVTHLNDDAFWHSMEIYKGSIWASHNNCRKFVNHNRQFSDEMITELINRKAVIGIALDAWMMVPDWIRGESDPLKRNVTLDIMVNNIDHICQLAGNSLHAGIGSDLDGGYGTEQCPNDLDTIADLQKLPALLKAKGYTGEDIQNIMHLNFVRYLQSYFF